ncbi:SDH family Clp fold serine proteinase [Leptospira levettii]|uniref:SDH family Clp fold serine proteinase n=1 Tax=Leptospira levettii TaxID=2023178 RepID=UPI003EBB9DC8
MSEPEETTEKKPQEQEKISIQDLFTAIVEGISHENDTEGKKIYAPVFKKYIKNLIDKESISSQYNILIYYDTGSMLKKHADSIYEAIVNFDKKKPILLVLFSYGGDGSSAYLIGKLCREHSEKKFKICVPRVAKSAATLLCCAADEIHMGSLSELGPIDPQINRLPALGLKNAIEHIAELIKKFPESSNMFAMYLNNSLQLIDLGYYERVAESAMQYAEKLLNTHRADLPKDASSIASHLVYSYKDHGFVIDKAEAITILSDKIVKVDTPEYLLSNKIYNFLKVVDSLVGLFKKNLSLIGSADSDPIFNSYK